MEIGELMKLLEYDRLNLAQVLEDCENNPDTHALLASKMRPLLDSFVDIEDAILKSVADTIEE